MQSDYQRHVIAKRQEKLKHSEVKAAWQPGGSFAAVEPQLSMPVTEDKAIDELIAAVHSGRETPWGMVGIKWETAVRLLELLEIKS